MSDKKCLGCGAVLSANSNDPGYVVDMNMDYCQACFKLKHYKEVKAHHHPLEIPKIKDHSLVLVITSVLYLDLVFTYPVKRYAPNSKIVYVVNQLDLLPHQTNYNYLHQRIRKEANLYHAEYEDIILMSSLHENDINNLKEYLLTYEGSDIYLLGVQNSGKTTIFNALTNQKSALTDVKAGLTQNLVSAKFDKYMLHDLPGLYQGGYIHEILSYEKYRHLMPLNEIKPINYQVKPNQSFVVNNLFAINYLKGREQPIVFYFNNPNINKTNMTKYQNTLSKALEFTKQIFKLQNNIKYQITIADIGLIHLNGPATVELVIPKNMHVSLRESFFL